MQASKENHNLYTTHLKSYARKNRSGMTMAEACLWKYALKARSMKGYVFNRQRPVLNYIADFMCKELQLIIEVDGSIHSIPEIIEKDKKRQSDLENSGFVVIRFTNDEVLKQMWSVKLAIEQAIEEIEKKKLPGGAG